MSDEKRALTKVEQQVYNDLVELYNHEWFYWRDAAEHFNTHSISFTFRRLKNKGYLEYRTYHLKRVEYKTIPLK